MHSVVQTHTEHKCQMYIVFIIYLLTENTADYMQCPLLTRLLNKLDQRWYLFQGCSKSTAFVPIERSKGRTQFAISKQ